MNTPAARKASTKYFKEREAVGLKRCTYWLTPEARAALAELAETWGSKDAVVSVAILQMARDERMRRAEKESAD